METQKVNKNENAITIGEMVAKDYRKAEVFKKFGFDFCCGGKKTLVETCGEKGVSITEVNEALQLLDNKQEQSSKDFNNMDIDDLVDHIINTHHKYITEALPLLNEFSEKVVRVHGNAHAEVIEIHRNFQAVADELQMHMQKEESILFPYIKQIAVAKRNNEQLPHPPFGTVKNPISMMETEHDSVGNALAVIKELSNNYTPPDDACNTYRVLYAKLNEFEEDLHQHIHLENNILFPKAIKLEEELLS